MQLFLPRPLSLLTVSDCWYHGGDGANLTAALPFMPFFRPHSVFVAVVCGFLAVVVSNPATVAALRSAVPSFCAAASETAAAKFYASAALAVLSALVVNAAVAAVFQLAAAASAPADTAVAAVAQPGAAVAALSFRSAATQPAIVDCTAVHTSTAVPFAAYIPAFARAAFPAACAGSNEPAAANTAPAQPTATWLQTRFTPRRRSSVRSRSQARRSPQTPSPLPHLPTSPSSQPAAPPVALEAWHLDDCNSMDDCNSSMLPQ